jgi:hypothetical protein
MMRLSNELPRLILLRFFFSFQNLAWLPPTDGIDSRTFGFYSNCTPSIPLYEVYFKFPWAVYFFKKFRR